MRGLIKWLLRYKGRVIAGFLTLFVVDIAGLMVPLVIREAIDRLARGEGGILQSAVIIVALASFAMIFRFLWRYFLIGASRKIERDLRADLYQHLLAMPASFYNERSTGDLMAHATNDIDAVTRASGFGVLTIADPLFMIPIAMGIMLSIAPTLALYAILPLPLLTLFMLGLGPVIQHRFEAIQEAFSTIMEKVRENVSGIRVVKSFVQEKGTNVDFNRVNQLLVDKNMALVRVWGVFHPFVEFMGGTSLLIIMWMGGRGVILSSISLGDFVAFSQYLMMLTWPMISLGWAVNLLQRGSASMARIDRILAVQPGITDPPQPRSLAGTDIKLQNLTFSYPSGNGDGGRPALSNIDLFIEEGMTLGIVGLTGAGKSTLVRLLPRILDPPPGSVFLGGTDIRTLSIKGLRQRIGFVPQDVFLFSQSIRENIAFGRPEAGETQVEQAAKLAEIYDEIMEFPHGFDTRVGERGVALSGGQKQRVAIARALLLNPDILILDDPLSAVDAEKEELILKNLRGFLNERSCIIIAHRISAVQNADRIIVLDRGEITESGVHSELVNSEGIYRRLWRLQQAEQRVTK